MVEHGREANFSKGWYNVLANIQRVTQQAEEAYQNYRLAGQSIRGCQCSRGH